MVAGWRRNRGVGHDTDHRLLGRVQDHSYQGDPALCPYLGADRVAASDHDGLYFVIFGKLIGAQIGDMDGFATSTSSSRPDPDVGDLQQLRQRRGEFLQQQVPAQHRGAADRADPNFVILAGYVGGGVARGVVVGVVVTWCRCSSPI